MTALAERVIAQARARNAAELANRAPQVRTYAEIRRVASRLTGIGTSTYTPRGPAPRTVSMGRSHK